MKRIYLLMTLALGISTAANAQMDIALTTTPPAGGVVFVSPDGDATENAAASINNIYGFTVKNTGTMDIPADDTMFVRINLVGWAIFPVGDWTSGAPLAVGDSIPLQFGGPGGVGGFVRDDVNFDEISAEDNIDLCDSSFLVENGGAIVSEITLANNTSCHNILLHFWALDVNAVLATPFNIYPNPAANQLNVTSTFNGAKNANVIIRDVVGKTVISQNLGSNISGVQTFSIDINNLSNGMYVVELNVDGQKQVKQIAVSK